jgi:hypothetical protein
MVLVGGLQRSPPGLSRMGAMARRDLLAAASFWRIRYALRSVFVVSKRLESTLWGTIEDSPARL